MTSTASATAAGAERHLGRRRRGWLVAVLALTVAAASCSAVTGSYSTSVRVTNNLSRPVILAMCNSTNCTKYTLQKPVAAGGSRLVRIGINSGYSPAIVRSSDGRQIGCLPFHLSKRPPANFVVKMSDAVPCGSTGGIQQVHGDWPDPNL